MQERNAIRRQVCWCIFDFLLIGFYLVTVGFIYYYCLEEFDYLNGLNGTGVGFDRVFYAYFLWLAAAGLFTVIILRLHYWEYLIINTKRLLLLRLATIGIVCVSTFFFAIIPSFFGKPNYVSFTEGYRDWAKSALDVQEIRTWMGRLDETGSFSIDEDFDGPRCLLDRGRFNAGIVFKDEDGEVSLSLHSGGGLWDWGVSIGPKGMEVPGFETVLDCDGYGEYRLRLEDGAYVWCEL